MDMVKANMDDIIKEKGLKKGYVAKKMGISKATLSNILSGRTRMDAGKIKKFCDEFGVEPNDLFRERSA